MGDHFKLDADPGAVAGAARRLGELGDHLKTRGSTAKSAPGRWAHGWHSKAATAMGEEATVLGGHLSDFAGHFDGASTSVGELARDLRHAKDVEVPDLNRRWQAAEDAYEQAVVEAQASYQRAVDGIEKDVAPQAARMIREELMDSRGYATSDAHGVRSAAQHKLELEYDDLCDRLTRYAGRVSEALSRAVALPVPPALVSAYRATHGNPLGELFWNLGGDLLGDLATDAERLLGGPLEKLGEGLRDPPQDYEEIQALLARARELGLPADQYRETLTEYWNYRAAEVAGIDLDDWDPSKGADYNRETIEAVYRYYGNLYLADPDLHWAGMANMIGPSFAAGFFDLAQFRRIAHAANDLPGPLEHALPPGIRELGSLSESEINFYETTFLDMQKQIFQDQGAMHQAYVDGGLPAIDEMLEAGIIDQATADGWRDIASGDPDRVQAGNTQFLLREQRDIIDDDYQKMLNHDPTGPAVTWAMTLIGAPSIPDARGYPDAFPLTVGFETPGPESIGTPRSIFGQEIPSVSVDNPTQVHVDVETPFPDGNIANFDDRWALIEQDTLPRFQELLANDPQRAREIIGSDVEDRIADYRMTERVDDIIGQMLDWDVDVDQ